VATLSEATEILRIGFYLNKNARLERDLKQILLSIRPKPRIVDLVNYPTLLAHG
jgi:hypothetical protein